MAQKTIKADLIKFPRKTLYNWDKKVLQEGEIVLEIGPLASTKMKIGIGTMGYSALPYAYYTPAEVDEKFLPFSGGQLTGNIICDNFSNGGLVSKTGNAGVYIATNTVSLVGNILLLKQTTSSIGNGMRIMGVADPINNTDGVNLKTLNSKTQEVSSTLLPLTGGTLTGDLIGTNCKFNKLTLNTSSDLEDTENGLFINSSEDSCRFSLKTNLFGQVNFINERAVPGTSFNFYLKRPNDVLYSMQYVAGIMDNESTIKFDIEDADGSRFTPLQIGANSIEFYNEDSSANHLPIQLDGVATPTTSNQAANKEYVDTAISNIPTYVLPTASPSQLGGIKTGSNNIVIGDNDVIDLNGSGIQIYNSTSTGIYGFQISNGGYSGGPAIVGFLNDNQGGGMKNTPVRFISGISLLNSNGQPGIISNVGNPINSFDVANKAYVDSKSITYVNPQLSIDSVTLYPSSTTASSTTLVLESEDLYMSIINKSMIVSGEITINAVTSSPNDELVIVMNCSRQTYNGVFGTGTTAFILNSMSTSKENVLVPCVFHAGANGICILRATIPISKGFKEIVFSVTGVFK